MSGPAVNAGFKALWDLPLDFSFFLSWFYIPFLLVLSSIGNPVLLGDFRVLRLQPGHKFCLLGRLSTEVGWHHYDTIKVCFDTP
jgi:hypothetical protein